MSTDTEYSRSSRSLRSSRRLPPPKLRGPSTTCQGPKSRRPRPVRQTSPRTQAGWQAHTVYVVGAGPGDPSLLTLKARRILASADLVAYDDLLHPKILAYTASHCRLVPVGYRGQMHQEAQAAMVLADRAEKGPVAQDPVASGAPPAQLSRERHPLVHPALVEAVAQGLRVVRLKCGDPMIFGRSAEEEEELGRSGIRCVYVPGITAALGAASHLGLPLTDRRYASQVIFQTATSEVQGKKTLVLYMPRKNLESICRQLVAEGWDPTTPVVFVAGATTCAEKAAHGTLADLSPLESCRTSHLPGLVVIGETVGLVRARGGVRNEAWHEGSGGGDGVAPDMELAGMRVLLLRASGSPSRIAAFLRKKGADVVEYPLVSAVPLEPSDLDDQEKARLCALLQEATALVMRTSRDVRMFCHGLKALGLDLRDIGREVEFLGLTRQAVRHLQDRGLRARFARDVRHPKILVPCGRGEKISVDVMTAASGDLTRQAGASPQSGGLTIPGAAPVPWPCYRYQCRGFRVRAPDPDVVVLPHRRALDLFLSQVAQDVANRQDPSKAQPSGQEILGFSWRQKPWTVFGPSLAQATRDLGVTGDITTAASLAEAVAFLCAFWRQSRVARHGDAPAPAARVPQQLFLGASGGQVPLDCIGGDS